MAESKDQDAKEQQATNAMLTSAPGTVEVGGKTFLVNKFTTASVYTLYEWSQKQAKGGYNPFREVCEALDGLNVSPEDKSRLLSQAHSVKMSGDVPADLMTDALRSCEGVAFQLWVLARNNHPDLTFAAAKALINEDNRLDVYCQLDVASGANTVNRAVLAAGFTLPGSTPGNTGSSATAAAPGAPSSTPTS